MQTGIELDQDTRRAALSKVLESEYFVTSRRLSEFLAYAGNAALEGRATVDQYEIADKVLGRADDFHPWDDATVRKLATQVRYKLEEYYAGPGSGDAIQVSLPKRSYVVRFQLRDVAQETAEPLATLAVADPLPAPVPPPVAEIPIIPATSEARSPRIGLWVAAGLTLICMTLAAVTVWRQPAETATVVSAPRIVIRTAQGDLRGESLDIAPDAVRTGLEIADGEEAMVRLQFRPDRPTQQAGLMAMVDADHFVRLGHHFKNRNLLEFAHETGGRFQTGAGTYEYDPAGQLGAGRWLAIRRQGNEYRGYLSSDGFEWRPYGLPLSLPPGPPPRAAFYAFNGRTPNPPATATFDAFGTALAFHDRPAGPWLDAPSAAWNQKIDCPSPPAVEVHTSALQVGFPDNSRGCTWRLTTRADQGDWAISALVDLEPVSGSSVGLTIRGAQRNLSLSRRDLDGRSLMLERSDDRDQRIPDFAGSPPVVLRLEKRGDRISASVSRDGLEWKAVGTPVALAEIGEPEQIGVNAGVAHWTSPVSRPPARIYWVRREPVTPGVIGRGNVP